MLFLNFVQLVCLYFDFRPSRESFILMERHHLPIFILQSIFSNLHLSHWVLNTRSSASEVNTPIHRYGVRTECIIVINL